MPAGPTSAPKTFDRNLIVIGGGAGGLVSRLHCRSRQGKGHPDRGAQDGRRLLELRLRAEQGADQERQAGPPNAPRCAQYGLSDANPSFSFKAVMQRVHDVIKAIEPHDSIERYTGLGVEVLQGYGRLVNPWTVEVALNDGTTQQA
jgi:pyruvate/2-oxoglutarate dehydrogenase complex dihydrolipoamide dehydrogenase (E3) component